MSLSTLDLLALIAILRLEDEAYGVAIHEQIEASAGRSVSMAGVYNSLDRLQRQGVVRTWLSEPRAERGGRARRLYGLTAAGRDLVKRERDLALRMWRGLAPSQVDRKR